MLSVILDDLAYTDADAIARPVNGMLRAITPLMRRLEQVAGDDLLRQCAPTEPLEVGSAIVTGAGALNAELMIHAVVGTDEQAVTRDGVRRATLSAMQRAADWQVRHLAIAPFGLGAGNLDVESASDAMMAGILEHRRRARHPERVTIIVESDLEAEVFGSAVARAGSAE